MKCASIRKSHDISIEKIQCAVQPDVVDRVRGSLAHYRLRAISDADTRFSHELQIVRAVADTDDLVFSQLELVTDRQQRLPLTVGVDDASLDLAGELARRDPQGVGARVVEPEARLETVGDVGEAAGYQQYFHSDALRPGEQQVSAGGKPDPLPVNALELGLVEPLEDRHAPPQALVIFDLAA